MRPSYLAKTQCGDRSDGNLGIILPGHKIPAAIKQEITSPMSLHTDMGYEKTRSLWSLVWSEELGKSDCKLEGFNLVRGARKVRLQARRLQSGQRS